MNIQEIVKKWQDFLGLNYFTIYALKEKPDVLRKTWRKDKRAKKWKAYVVKADTVYDLTRDVVLIRLNEDLTNDKEIEKVILHELLHIKIDSDEEWVIEELVKHLI